MRMKDIEVGKAYIGTFDFAKDVKVVVLEKGISRHSVFYGGGKGPAHNDGVRVRLDQDALRWGLPVKPGEERVVLTRSIVREFTQEDQNRLDDLAKNEVRTNEIKNRLDCLGLPNGSYRTGFMTVFAQDGIEALLDKIETMSQR